MEGFGQQVQSRSGESRTREDALGLLEGEHIEEDTHAPVQERVMFPGKGSWLHLSLDPIGELASIPITGADTMDILNKGEKIFVFRNPKEPEISLHLPPRGKRIT